MATHRYDTPRRDLHQDVTDRIVAAIEAGAGEWRMPWTGQHGGLPFNATTKAKYRGVNVLTLWLTASAAGFPTNEWASYLQWQERGAQVRRGERGSQIVYYGTTTRERENDAGELEETEIRFLRYSHVFNAAQVDGWQSPAIERPNLATRIEAAERFVSNTGALIRYGLGRAYYSPTQDSIGMPEWAQFLDTPTATATENAYGTLLHELTHWTGHEKRCAREFGKRFGNDAYAAEELVAELGSAFLCAELAITPEPRLRVHKADKRAIFTAASKASEAADYLHSLQTATATPIAA